MKRLRLTVLFATLAVMLLGVQAVHACQAWFTLNTSNGRYTCWNTGSEGGHCQYTCSYERIQIV
ncbi:MAG TPA: hypothetical protein VF883_12250 [Thermoanaerobaculia bacterium]|jgi:hypothetical protein